MRESTKSKAPIKGTSRDAISPDVGKAKNQNATLRALLIEWCALHEDVLDDTAPSVIDLLRRSGLATLPEQIDSEP